MINIFIKHQKVILRSLGALMLLVGFVIHFWSSPDTGMTKAQIAAANVARMEASVSGANTPSAKAKPDVSHVVKAIKDTQAKQMQYFTIIIMIFGAGFLGYSFLQKQE